MIDLKVRAACAIAATIAACLFLLVVGSSPAGADEFGYSFCGSDNSWESRYWEPIGSQMFGLRSECDGATYQYLQAPTTSVLGADLRVAELGPGRIDKFDVQVTGRDLNDQYLDFALAVCVNKQFPAGCGTQLRGSSVPPYVPQYFELSRETGEIPEGARYLVLYAKCTREDDFCPVGASHVEFSDIYVIADDPTPPTVTTGSAISTTDWYRETPDPFLDAVDEESGIKRSVVTLNDSAGYTEPCNISGQYGCPREANPLDLSQLHPSQGRNFLSVRTFNGAGMPTDRSYSFLFDSVAPSAPANLRVAGLQNGWLVNRNLNLRWNNTGENEPTETASGIASAKVTIEPEGENGPYTPDFEFDGAGIASASLTLPWAGNWTVRVQTADAAGNVSGTTSTEVKVEEGGPGSPLLWQGSPPPFNLVNTAQPITLSWYPSGFGLSGDCGYRGWIGNGVPPDLAANPSTKVASSGVSSWTIGTAGLGQLSDGLNNVAVAAVDCAGLVGPASVSTIFVDRVAPVAWLDPTRRWLGSGDDLTVHADDPGAPSYGSGLESVWYRIDGGSRVSVYGNEASIPLPPGRHTLDWGAVDQLGNESSPHEPATVGIDEAPPSASVEEVPGVVGAFKVRVSDEVSGVVDAWCEIAPNGSDAWRRVGDRFVATNGERAPLQLGLRVPDDAGLPPGDYALRVVARDEAGNILTSVLRTLRLPLRSTSSITALLSSAKTPKASHRSLTTNFGEDTVLRGTLRDAAGSPISRAALRVVAQRVAGGRRVVASTTTDDGGGYSVKLGADVSRSLIVNYSGDSTRGPASATANQSVRAQVKMRLSASRVRRGGRLYAVGRVATLSASVPAGGIPVEIQYCGRTSCTKIGIQDKSDSAGGFRIVIPTPYSSRTRLTLRAHVASFPGWPFADGFSPRRSVVIR